MIEQLAGVIIGTDDLQRMVRFYRDTLGLTPHTERHDRVSFRWGQVRLSIGRHSRVHGTSRDPHRIMINFNVSDIRSVSNRLKNVGVEFIRRPEKEHWGGWVATFYDPDGNILQLLEQPDHRDRGIVGT